MVVEKLNKGKERLGVTQYSKLCVCYLFISHLCVCVFANRDRVCLKGIRAVVFDMAMGNPNTQERMDLLEQELEKLKETIVGQVRGEVSAAIEQFSKKQDKTEKLLAALMEGQAKILDKGAQTESNHRRQSHNREVGDEGQNLEWVCQNENDFRYSQREERTQEKSNWKTRRLELPPFNGQEPDEWILKAEKYLTFYQLNEREKVKASVVSFKGEAMIWYHWVNQRTPLKCWED